MGPRSWIQRAWLAKWLEGRRRGRVTPLLPAPVLVPQIPSLAVWAWNYADPPRWYAYKSLDGGATFVVDAWEVGSARQYAPDGGQRYMFIVGADANGNEITARSNAVKPDDAASKLMPAPVLVPLYPSMAAWTWGYANPARWWAHNSLDGGMTYKLDDWVQGTARQYAPDGGQHYMFIVGTDTDGNEVTLRSNAVRPDDAQPVPGPPLNLVASDGVTVANLDWTLGSGTITGQRIYRKLTSGGSYSLLTTVGPAAVHYTDSTVSMTTYSYYVVASNTYGDSVASNEATTSVGA